MNEQTPGDKIKEVNIQRKMEKELGGKHEVCPTGVADIITDTELIEIKNWKQWITALGQIFAYKIYFPNKNLRIHFR